MRSYHHAASLLQKSTQACDTFFPAWYDLVAVYAAKNERINAHEALQAMKMRFKDQYSSAEIVTLERDLSERYGDKNVCSEK